MVRWIWYGVHRSGSAMGWGADGVWFLFVLVGCVVWVLVCFVVASPLPLPVLATPTLPSPTLTAGLDVAFTEILLTPNGMSKGCGFVFPSSFSSSSFHRLDFF